MGERELILYFDSDAMLTVKVLSGRHTAYNLTFTTLTSYEMKKVCKKKLILALVGLKPENSCTEGQPPSLQYYDS
jgi:hypothetical protein